MQARQRLSRLTQREREVCDSLMAGMLNKQIAWQLGIAESTVKVHRSRMMEKLALDSVIELVRFLDRAGVSTPAPTTSPAVIEDSAACPRQEQRQRLGAGTCAVGYGISSPTQA